MRNEKTEKQQNDELDEIVESISENEELTDREKLFCANYIKCFNATKAYQKVYDCNLHSASSNGYRLLRYDRVRAEITRLKKLRMKSDMLSENDIYQKMIDIAFSDLTDYLTFESYEQEITEDIEVEDDGEPTTIQKPKTIVRNRVKLKDSTEVDGSLITELTQGRDGIKIKLADKMKALEWLADRMELIPTVTKQRIEIEKSKLFKESDTENNVGDVLKGIQSALEDM